MVLALLPPRRLQYHGHHPTNSTLLSFLIARIDMQVEEPSAPVRPEPPAEQAAAGEAGQEGPKAGKKRKVCTVS